MYKNYLKRFFDIIFSLLGLIILFIPMLLIALMIRLDDKGPALFKQKRVGKNKKYYYMYKFRSMRTDAPEIPTLAFTDSGNYVTRLGMILRKSSLDELPQLWNILKGDMSFIGPRPALWNEYDLIEERDKYNANTATPGLTGLAQISGRNEITMEEKAFLDSEYIKKLSFGLDLKCILSTIPAVISGRGYSRKENEQEETTIVNKEIVAK